mgnify:CR=1 FL=1
MVGIISPYLKNYSKQGKLTLLGQEWIVKSPALRLILGIIIISITELTVFLLFVNQQEYSHFQMTLSLSELRQVNLKQVGNAVPRIGTAMQLQ